MTGKERKEKRCKRRKEERGEKRGLDGYSFSLITDPDNLYDSFQKSQINVSWKCSIQRYESQLLFNISNTIKELEKNGVFQRGFVEFDLHERGKVRHIKSVHISERVVQKCLCDKVLVPVFSPSLIYDNSASLKNKGMHFAIRRLITHLGRFYRCNGFSNKGYVLTVDIHKYFDTVRHDVLLKNMKKYIKDPKIMNLITSFVTVFGDNVSLGLGSQVSQICAIYYLNELDHNIKEKLHIKYYARYMDDFYLIHESKEYLKYCLSEIIEVCGEMGLEVNIKKTKIDTLEHGFIFLKGRYSLTKKGRVMRLPCRASSVQMRRKLIKFEKIMGRKGRINYYDIYTSYQSWRNTYRKRFFAYYRVKKMDELYNRLFIQTH